MSFSGMNPERVVKEVGAVAAAVPYQGFIMGYGVAGLLGLGLLFSAFRSGRF